MDSSSLSHCKWECQYHIVFIPKYRKKVLYGKVREDVREIIRTLCKYKKVEIVAGAVCVDHVHLCVSIPPKISISDFVGYLKGKSALMIYDKHPEMGNKWDRSFWARGYYEVFRCSVPVEGGIITIPIQANEQGLIDIKVDLPDAVSPDEIEHSGDGRKLALKLFDMSLVSIN